MSKEISREQQGIVEWMEWMGFDVTNPEYANSTNSRGLTPLMEVITMFGESHEHDKVASAMLKQLLELGADPKLIVELPSAGEVELVNAISFAVSSASIPAFTIIYDHDPASIYAEMESGLNALVCLLSPLDEATFAADDCEKYKALIRLLVQEKHCDVKAFLPDGFADVPIATEF